MVCWHRGCKLGVSIFIRGDRQLPSLLIVLRIALQMRQGDHVSLGTLRNWQNCDFIMFGYTIASVEDFIHLVCVISVSQLVRDVSPRE